MGGRLQAKIRPAANRNVSFKQSALCMGCRDSNRYSKTNNPLKEQMSTYKNHYAWKNKQ